MKVGDLRVPIWPPKPVETGVGSENAFSGRRSGVGGSASPASVASRPSGESGSGRIGFWTSHSGVGGIV